MRDPGREDDQAAGRNRHVFEPFESDPPPSFDAEDDLVVVGMRVHRRDLTGLVTVHARDQIFGAQQRQVHPRLTGIELEIVDVERRGARLGRHRVLLIARAPIMRSPAESCRRAWRSPWWHALAPRRSTGRSCW